MDTTLVIMAAGIGSRFGGGIKQLEPVGPNGEIIMDYSIYDALKAGFTKVIFIIRKDLEKDFREIIGNRIEKIIDVEYAFQELDDLPMGFSRPEGRTKPWGTGQAVLSIKGKLKGAFAVINADDFYGSEVFKIMYEYLVDKNYGKSDIFDLCMGGFILKNTLSENGGVSRGVCKVSSDNILEDVKETYEIKFKGTQLLGVDGDGKEVKLDPEQFVSMNMWGLPEKFLEELEKGFPKFLGNIKEGDLKKEYLLPTIIDACIKEGRAKVKVLRTEDKWFGVTYKEDKESVVSSIRNLIDEGKYPQNLYGDK